jgi:tRNA(Ile2) C34 agmatinyltransferase TiaS
MPQFVCPTCGARLYSASPLTKCAWCGTSLSSESIRKPSDEADGGDAEQEDDSD